MQPLLAAPRDHLTEDQVRYLLTLANPDIGAGLELLDGSNNFLADLSTDLGDGGSINYDNRAFIRGSCNLALQRALAWGRDRVRPYMTISRDSLSARFNLGVYILTAPEEHRGEDPITYQATGYDLLSRMQRNVGDTWVVEAGTTYFAAAQAIVTASGVGAQLLLDPDARDTVLPATRVWAITESQTTYLRILTDLLADISYERPTMDPDGNITSKPFEDAATRAPEYVLDPATSDSIVGDDRTVATEVGDGYNAWRFIMANADVLPTTGNGLIYVPTPNTSEGPNSSTALGQVNTRIAYLQAADAAELAAAGDKIVAQDKAAVRTINLTIDPLPIMWSDDVFTYTDLGTSEKIAAASWSLNLDGSSGPLQLGGQPATPLEPVEVQAKATVTVTAPLTVLVDGAATECFANALGDIDGPASYDIGDRVTVTLRNPVPPLVQGVES